MYINTTPVDDLLLSDWGFVPAVHPPYAGAVHVQKPVVEYDTCTTLNPNPFFFSFWVAPNRPNSFFPLLLSPCVWPSNGSGWKPREKSVSCGVHFGRRCQLDHYSELCTSTHSRLGDYYGCYLSDTRRFTTSSAPLSSSKRSFIQSSTNSICDGWLTPQPPCSCTSSRRVRHCARLHEVSAASASQHIWKVMSCSPASLLILTFPVHQCRVAAFIRYCVINLDYK